MVEYFYENRIVNEDVKKASLGGAAVGGLAGTVIVGIVSAPGMNADVEIYDMKNQLYENEQFSTLTPYQQQQAKQKLHSLELGKPDKPDAPEIGGLIGGGIFAGALVLAAATVGARALRRRLTRFTIDRKVEEGKLKLYDDRKFDAWRSEISV